MSVQAIRCAFRVVVIALLSAALVGCSDPKAKVVGTYEVDKTSMKAAAEAKMKAKPESDPTGMGAAMVAGMIDAMTFTMTLNADGSATLSSTMMGQTETTTGTWTLSGDKISITAAESDDKAKETITGTVANDTITLTAPDGEEVPFDLVFKKKPA